MSQGEKKKKEDKSLFGKKGLDIAARGIVDNIVFSKTEKWAFYRIKNEVYDFLSNSGKVAQGQSVANALSALMSNRTESLECLVVATTRPIDVDSWAAQVKTTVEDWDGRSAGFENYAEEQKMLLKTEEYHSRTAYIGINLGKRGAISSSDFNILESGINGAIDQLKEWFSTALDTPGVEVTEKEENEARRLEADLYRTLSTGYLKGERITSEEILLLIKRQFYPMMPSPYLDVDHENRLGPGDLSLELHSSIRKHWRFLRFDQMYNEHELTGYRTCMTFSKFPKFSEAPNMPPFLYYPAAQGLPFTTWARFELISSTEMMRDVEKRKKEQADELENIEGGKGGKPAELDSNPADVVEGLSDVNRISEILAQDKSPWVKGNYHVVVEARSQQGLLDMCTALQQAYNEMGINLSWSSGAQADLFLSQMPGDNVRLNAFEQVSTLSMLATSGFNISSEVGDPVYGED